MFRGEAVVGGGVRQAPSAMQMWMQTHCSATIAAHSCKQVTRLSNSNLYCFLDKTVE